MASIRLAYLGGGSSRAAGTMAAFIHNHGQRFAGSEVVLIDLDAERLAIVHRLAERMTAARGLDLRFRSTTDQRAGLTDVDAVLSSYRPGGFESRVLDEQIPLEHGIIGQETQGPGGFFMALRSIHVLQGVVETLGQVAPRARIFNYTNPVNIVAQAATRHTDVPFTSFCEGTYDFPMELADAAGLDRSKISARMVGLNHTTWSYRVRVRRSRRRHAGDPCGVGADAGPGRRRRARSPLRGAGRDHGRHPVPVPALLLLPRRDPRRAASQAHHPLRRTSSRGFPTTGPTTSSRASRTIHELDPARSRGGIFELELALDAIDSYYNDLGLVLPVNTPNVGGALAGFDEDVVVEVFARVDKDGVHPEPTPALPRHVAGLIGQLAEYQYLAADAAWSGSRRDAVRALSSHPWLTEIRVAEALYDEMAAAHKEHLPERLLR